MWNIAKIKLNYENLSKIIIRASRKNGKFLQLKLFTKSYE